MSGVVEDTGPAVKEFKKGDRVYTRSDSNRNGSYAEYIAVPETGLMRKPVTIDHIGAAAIPLAGLTAWQGLFTHGKLQPGQKVLIHGASGGVGTFAVQFAKWKGAYVIGTASKENHSFLQQLGADEVVDYHVPDYEKNIRDVDLVFDTIGGDTQKRSLQVLKPGGLLVTTLKVEDSTKAAFREKGAGITSMLTETRKEDLDAITRLVDEGRVKPVIYRVFPLEKAAEAEQLSQSGHVRGKIVLQVGY